MINLKSKISSNKLLIISLFVILTPIFWVVINAIMSPNNCVSTFVFGGAPWCGIFGRIIYGLLVLFIISIPFFIPLIFIIIYVISRVIKNKKKDIKKVENLY